MAATRSFLLLICKNASLTEMKAADLFYNSKTFTQLANKSTEFYLKFWQEIYEMLKAELKIYTV
jgi:hypothetical protein